MRFTVHGVWQGKDVAVTWDDGRIDGPPEIVSLLEVHADLRRDGLGPALAATESGPHYDSAGLANPVATLLLCQQLFDRIDAIGDGTDTDATKLEVRARGVMRTLGA